MFDKDPLAEYLAAGGQVGFRLRDPVVEEVPSVLTDIPQEPLPDVGVGPASGVGANVANKPQWWDDSWGAYGTMEGMMGMYGSPDMIEGNRIPGVVGPAGVGRIQGYSEHNDNYMGIPTQTSEPADTSSLYNPRMIALKQR